MLDKLAIALATVGALNWGSVGLFRFDVVGALLGGQLAPLSRIVFALVGLAGIWCVVVLVRGMTDGETHTA